ncbi:MAG: EamA family transporter [Pseudomonadales bacterium]|nr:EamA family transporter [Pseudomonadales bacterium]
MSAKHTNSSWFYILTTALAPLIWGSTYIVTTEWLPPDRPFTAALLRILPAGVLLVLMSRHFPAKHDWGRLVILAVLNMSFFQAFLFIAAYRLPGGLAAVVSALQPLLVMGLTWGVDGQRPVGTAVAASALGVMGMAALLLSQSAVWDPVGIAAAIAGTACMATGTFLAQRWRTDVPLLAFTGWQLLAGGIMLIPVARLIDPPLPILTITQMFAYAYLSLFGAVLAYVLWFRGIARLSPAAVSSLGLLSPLTAVVIGWALLNQSMTGLSLAGLITVLVSVLAVQRALTPTNETTTRRLLSRVARVRT